ncbi:MAG: monovalent cation/H+ antiporter subunit D family protein [Alphaproteobacteria bacterium]|nr:monovalent cation/H+ antiporter subunit D family protein [Alphaproteobacteria bacterium]
MIDAVVQHLPAWQVVLPLLGAPICILLRRPAWAWAWTVLVTWATAACAAVLLRTTLDGGPWIYEMGGWPSPIGIVYRVDPLAAFVLLIVSGVGAVVSLYARRSLTAELQTTRHDLYYAAYLLCLAGLLGMTITGDAFNVFVFLEISSLASYVLVGLGPDRRALTAAYRYLIAGALGGTFILIGIGLAYQMTGTLNMDDLAQRLPPVSHSRTVLVSFAFITVGASLKLALWPLHHWLPNAYTYAPSVTSAFISATSTKVMVYVLARFAFGIYGEPFAFEELGLGRPLLVLALSGIYVASAVAIFQTDVKRLLAYSSVAQIGYMILGISLATPAGVAAGVLHLFNHAVTKGGMFLAVGAMAYRTGSTRLEDLRGVGRVMPVSTLAFVLGGFGLIGVPLTAGFVTKWALLEALWAEGLWPVAIAVLLSSLLAVVYVGKVVETAWFHEPSEALRARAEAPVDLLLPAWILVGLSLIFGVWGAWTTGVAREAALRLLGGA